MRLFTAFSISPAAHAALAAAVDGAGALPGAPRWTGSDLWHVTLVFLGEVEEAGLPRLYRELEAAGAAIPPFPLRLSGAGVFPPKGPPAVLWAGLDGDLRHLTGLARALRRAARQARIEVERRPYHPHLTLGRWRPRDGAVLDGTGPELVPVLAERIEAADAPEFWVSEYSLYRSHFPAAPGGGPMHEVLATWPLSQPSPGGK